MPNLPSNHPLFNAPAAENKDNPHTVLATDAVKAKRDFFGRIITPLGQGDANPRCTAPHDVSLDKHAGANQVNGQLDKATKSGVDSRNDMSERVWVTYHEGFSNAVRKSLSLAEFLKGL